MTATNVEAVKANPPGNVEEFLVKFYHVIAPAYMIKGVGAGRQKLQQMSKADYLELS